MGLMRARRLVEQHVLLSKNAVCCSRNNHSIDQSPSWVDGAKTWQQMTAETLRHEEIQVKDEF